MIVDDFKEILENYERISDSEPYVQNDFARRIRQDFKESIRVFIDSFVNDRELYHIKGNSGRFTNWAKNANIRIGNYNSCKSFQIGLYLFYFFKRDGDGVYLSLDQGHNNPNNQSIRIQIAEKLIQSTDLEIPDGFVTDISEGKLYPDSIMSKFYKYDELSQEVLENDLKEMIKIYEKCIPNYLEILKNMNLTSVLEDIYSSGKTKEIIELIISKTNADEDVPFKHNEKRNLIYFGAPGTGKSYNLNKDKDKLLGENFKDNYERVTFYPDYSYANFVGTYKPVTEDENIKYEYIPGPFMRVLSKALEKPSEPFLLIIEEINRANVAAVFGDIFQLLDRDDNYESIYPIETTEDMRRILKKNKLKIPQNMFIWATMNSADQGVFPMDTAFKRRWDFEYFGINYGEENIKNTFVNLNDEKISWNKLRIAINNQLLEYKINEDKLLGPFFAFTEYLNQEIPSDVFKEVFQNKIIMYLFEDAARSRRNDLFEGSRGDKTYVTYSKICDDFNSKRMGIFCDSIRNADLSVDE